MNMLSDEYIRNHRYLTHPIFPSSEKYDLAIFRQKLHITSWKWVLERRQRRLNLTSTVFSSIAYGFQQFSKTQNLQSPYACLTYSFFLFLFFRLIITHIDNIHIDNMVGVHTPGLYRPLSDKVHLCLLPFPLCPEELVHPPTLFLILRLVPFSCEFPFQFCPLLRMDSILCLSAFASWCGFSTYEMQPCSEWSLSVVR